MVKMSQFWPKSKGIIKNFGKDVLEVARRVLTLVVGSIEM